MDRRIVAERWNEARKGGGKRQKEREGMLGYRLGYPYIYSSSFSLLLSSPVSRFISYLLNIMMPASIFFSLVHFHKELYALPL